MNDNDARRFASVVTLAFCFLTSALEGFDLASMGLAAPKLVPELHLSAQHLGLVLSAVPLGMFLGALLGGRLADVLGRKTTLIIAVAVIGVFQLATAFAPSYEALIGARVLCGIGIGGAITNVIALASEAAGETGSVFNVTLVMAGLPAGGTVASLIAIAGGEQGDWRTNFYIGGLAPLILAATMMISLPESREFLKVRTAELGQRSVAGILATLFGRGRTLTTLWLWISYFTTSVIVYVLVNWTPTLMSLKGFSKTDAVSVGLPLGIGGVIGPILIGRLIQQRRSPGLLLYCYAGVAIGLIGLAEVGRNFTMALIAVAVPATLVQAASFTLAGLAPQYYPTATRGTGTGAAVGAARLGAISGPASVGFLISAGLGPTQVLWSLVPVALLAALTGYMLIVTGKPAPAQPKREASAFGLPSAEK
jgi:MFS transporter, AAHS family, 3-hydroxyphenylpropionic acid transporter